MARDLVSGDIVATANRVTIKADAPRSAWAGVESVQITKTGFKLCMHDKAWALDGLATLLGLFDEAARTLCEPPQDCLQRPATFWRLLATSAPDKACSGSYNKEPRQ